jgi:triacylglycerol lipase
LDFDCGWQALARPGEATRYFDGPQLPRFDLAAPRFSLEAAWWLAELSRLAYRRGAEETIRSASQPTRGEILDRVGLYETHFFDDGCVQGTLVETSRAGSSRHGVLVFRGTDGWRDWGANLRVYPTRREGAGRVHRGFQRALDGVWQQVSDALREFRGELVITGHSLGGALAVLAASRLAPAAVYTFGAPRVADAAFARGLADTCAFRVVHGADIVPKVPPASGLTVFRHVGLPHLIPPCNTRNGTRDPFDPPAILSDHAPVNYVAALEREIEDACQTAATS